jgi:hypothetical protein
VSTRRVGEVRCRSPATGMKFPVSATVMSDSIGCEQGRFETRRALAVLEPSHLGGIV